MTQQQKLSERASDLRRAFDEAFAALAAPPAADQEDYLAVRCGDVRYVLCVTDLTGLGARRKIVPLPASDPSLLGLAGIQGQLVPVYDLARLLGHETPEAPAWIALCGRDQPIGLAFQELQGHLRLARSQLYPPDQSNRPRPFLREAVRAGNDLRHVLDVPAILAAINARGGSPPSGRQANG